MKMKNDLFEFLSSVYKNWKLIETETMKKVYKQNKNSQTTTGQWDG